MNGSGEIDGENLGVLRLRTDVLRESTAGLIMTWGDPAGGRATTAGVDFNWRRSDSLMGALPSAMHGPSSPTTKTALVVLSAASCRTQATRLIRGKRGYSRVLIPSRFCSGSRPTSGSTGSTAWRPSNPLIRRVSVGMFGSIYDEIRPNARFDRMTFEPWNSIRTGRPHQRQVGAASRAIGRCFQSNRRCFGRRW